MSNTFNKILIIVVPEQEKRVKEILRNVYDIYLGDSFNPFGESKLQYKIESSHP